MAEIKLKDISTRAPKELDKSQTKATTEKTSRRIFRTTKSPLRRGFSCAAHRYTGYGRQW